MQIGRQTGTRYTVRQEVDMQKAKNQTHMSKKAYRQKAGKQTNR